jgi:methylenetetrahydrofolate--tRNA-(uracil-5-)-methyltransferase
MGSLILRCADGHRVAAGGALAVDRISFARAVTEALRARPNVEIVEEEVLRIPTATSSLPRAPLPPTLWRGTLPGSQAARDCISLTRPAPIVTLASVDMTKAFFASRYGKGTP